MTSSKEKSLNIWEMPKTWMVEDEPEAKQNDEDSKFKSVKLDDYKQNNDNHDDYLEHHNEPIEENKYFEDEHLEDEKMDKPVDNTQALQNLNEGFDPLGGGKFKAADVNNDDLLGWNN
jgi:hypothetical protein